MKRFFKKSLVMTLVTVLLIGTFAISADAVMKRTVKKQGFSTETSVVNKKAATVKKGTTNLTYSKGQGWVKFKAPSTKTYKFTFSNLKAKGGSNAYVSFLRIWDYDNTGLTHTKVSTKGGKNEALFLCSNDRATGKSGKVIYRALHSRTGKIKLKKGQTIYLYFNSTTTKKNTMKLVIK